MFDLIKRTIEKAFEPCKSCEVLKSQLEIANHERAELLQTIMGLVKPEVIQHPLVPVQPILSKSLPWAARKKALEENDREQMRIRRDLEIQKAKVQTTTTVEELEKELGVEDASQIG